MLRAYHGRQWWRKPVGSIIHRHGDVFLASPLDNRVTVQTKHQLTSTRPYVFLPSSFQELKHDFQLWWDRKRKEQTVRVKLFNDTWNKTKARFQRQAKTTHLRTPSRKALSIKYNRWRNRFKSLTTTKRIKLTEYAHHEWFDSDGYPLTSKNEAGRFVNPWSSESTNGYHTIWEIIWWRTHWLYTRHLISPSTIQTVPVDFVPQDADAIRFTWIGHSTSVVQLRGYNLITDPHFSPRAAPMQIPLPMNGVGRHVSPACDISDLPETVHVCLISHDHYDHLDRNSCIMLKDRVRRWIVPLGLKDWLIEKCAVNEADIEELKWWDETTVECFGLKPLRITCAPTQHWSCRTMFDRNQRLWCSFSVKCDGKSFYFGGDTAMPMKFPLFAQIGQRLGPFDLAALPIGAYAPRFFMSDSHVDPNEAVEIHKQIGAKKSVAIHWGCFRLADEPDDEPRQLLQKAAERESVHFVAIKLGESIEVGGSTAS